MSVLRSFDSEVVPNDHERVYDCHSMSHRWMMLTGALCLYWVSGCSSSDSPARHRPAAVHVELTLGAGIPAFGEVPFPSDLQLGADGTIAIDTGLERVVASSASVITDGFVKTHGYARQGNGVFFLDGAVDGASLPGAATADSGSVVLVDVDDASPRRGTRYPVRARFLPTLGCITVAALPGIVLPPGVRHAFVMTTKVLDDHGDPIGPSPDLEHIESLAPAARATPAEKLYGGALDAVVDLGVVTSATEVAGLAVFTTSSTWEELFALRTRLRSGEFPAPNALWDPVVTAPYNVAIFSAATTPNLDAWLGTAPRDASGNEWPGGDNPGGVAHDAIAAVASFAMKAPSFLDPATNHLESDGNGGIRLASNSELVPVTIVIPKSAAPASGYPVVIHGHGLSNDRGSMLSNANELARAGFVVIGIDDVLHGTRAGIPDVDNRFPGTYRGPDGIPDALPFAVKFLGGFTDFLGMRDNFRQTIVDQMSLVRLVENATLDLTPIGTALGGVAPKLDGAHVAWSGGSLGGIVGSMTASVEPDILAAAFQVPGAGFIPFIVTGSAKLSVFVEAVSQTTFSMVGSEPLDELHPLGLLLAHITEAGDPLAYAGAIYGDRPAGADPRRPHVMIGYTVDDEVLPNISTHALLRTIGLPIVGPTLVEPDGVPLVGAPVSGNQSGLTAAATQYAPSTHALGYNRWDIRQYQPGFPTSDPSNRFPLLPKQITIELPIREYSNQLVTFLTSALAGAPQITITAPVRKDFDADGVTDDAEIAAGTDPWDPASF